VAKEITIDASPGDTIIIHVSKPAVTEKTRYEIRWDEEEGYGPEWRSSDDRTDALELGAAYSRRKNSVVEVWLVTKGHDTRKIASYHKGEEVT
jgi:hypothetical protein